MIFRSPAIDNSSSADSGLSMGKRVRKPESTGSGKLPVGADELATKKLLEGITPFRIIITMIMLGVLGYLYISHVFYTQQLHAEVTRLRLQNEQVRIDHLNTRLTYERMTGPAEVYQRAKSLGLIDGGPADFIITTR